MVLSERNLYESDMTIPIITQKEIEGIINLVYWQRVPVKQLRMKRKNKMMVSLSVLLGTLSANFFGNMLIEKAKIPRIRVIEASMQSYILTNCEIENITSKNLDLMMLIKELFI